MNIIFQYTDWQEIIAGFFFFGVWFGYSRYANHANRRHASLLALNDYYRLQWMQQMIKRKNRMADATMIGNLMRNINFFANTTIFIVLGLMTMLGYHERALGIISAIPFAKSVTPLMWEIKIFLLILIFVYAFFKYTWSIRQYTFAGIFIVSVPAHDDVIENPDEIARKGAYLVGSAAEYFNNGLRAYYYGLAALAWFIHPCFLMIATIWVTLVTYRREFRSKTLKALSHD